MTEMENIESSLSHLKPELVSAMKREGVLKDIPAGTEILREGQYVKVIPIVIQGLIKVLTRHDDKELLLYYIRPKESCIMSFAASLKNEPSRVFASTEEDTRALLLPVDKVSKWTAQFPDINNLFFQQYNLRYADLLDTIHHVLFDKLDKRLYDYLVEKVALTRQNPLKMSHREIANELATAREVISRTMKKLESENLIKQHSNSIELLNR
jgi:CRP/FNR family transcriptional regulator